MLEHLSSQDLERYRQSALPPQELLAVDDHLAACGQCRAQLDEVVPATTAWQTLNAHLDTSAERIEHLSYEQLAAYVDEQLDGAMRQAAENHLEFCEMCAAELQDLRAFSVEVAALPQPAATPTPTITPQRSFWQQLTGLVTVRWPVLAGASALLALVAWLLLTQLREREQTPPPIIVATSPTLAPSPTPASVESNPPAPAGLLALNDGGGRVTLDQTGHLTSPQPLPAAYEQMLKRALMSGRVETPRLTGLNVKTGSLMGGNEGVPFALLDPVAKVIEPDRPSFRWQSLAGTVSYTVTIYDANFNRVSTSPPLSATEWRVAQPLPRGVTYSWQVKAIKDGQEMVTPVPPAPEAKFKILEQDKAEELERARRQFAGSHLTLGLLYARAGLLDEAERELQAVVGANRDSAVARKLLRNVQAARRGQ